MILLFFCALLVSFLCGHLLRASGREHPHRIVGLPGDEADGVKQFAGHLQVDNDTFVFYWFIKAEEEAEKKPLVFVSSDGPGCSPVFYLLNGLGPHSLDKTSGRLARNEHSWTKLVNLVVVDAPSGTGFSFNRQGSLRSNDINITNTNYAFIRNFFHAHPAFRNHSVFLAGASYGARHHAFLAEKILNNRHEFPVDLKGLFLGNAIFTHPYDDETYLQFQYWHGFIGEHAWQRLLAACCEDAARPSTCSWGQSGTRSCSRQMSSLRKQLSADPINEYDFRGECHQKDSPSIPPCIDAAALTKFMNEPAVQRALNLHHEEPFQWSFCNPKISVNSNFDVLPAVDRKAQLKRIVNAGVRLMSFAGDSDLLCNVVLEQRTIADLGFEPLLEHKLWYANLSAGSQLQAPSAANELLVFPQQGAERRSKRSVQPTPSGFLTLYEKNLTFATIFGGGHGFVTTRMAEIRRLFVSFLSNDFRHLLLPDANLR